MEGATLLLFKIEEVPRPSCSAWRKLQKMEIRVSLYSRFELFLLLDKDDSFLSRISIRPLPTKEVGA